MILWTYVHDHTQTFVAGHGRLAAVSMGFSLVCEQSGSQVLVCLSARAGSISVCSRPGCLGWPVWTKYALMNTIPIMENVQVG